MDDIHDTASEYYLAMIANGKVPLEVVGGPLDGVRYFPVEIDGREYWVTDRGLFDPPRASLSEDLPAMADGFTPWARWSDRDSLPGLKYPGVYLLAMSTEDLSSTGFSLRPEIVYVGMTNSKGGLRSRLRQFDNTIRGDDGHGGALRFLGRHPDYGQLVGRLYVSVRSFECNTSSRQPGDLRTMGEVAKCEYECIADYVETYGHEPEFNDQGRSPKQKR